MNNRLCISLLLLLASLPVIAYSQSSEELEKQKQQLEYEIARMQRMLANVREKYKSSVEELTLVSKQIRKREQLIGLIEQELEQLNAKISEQQEVVYALTRDLETLRKQYTSMLKAAYKQLSTHQRLSYLLTGENPMEILKRYIYLNKIAEHRKMQADMIKATQQLLANEVAKLHKQKQNKEELLQQLKKQKEQYEAEKQRLEELRESLQKQRTQLERQLADRKKALQKLEEAIKEALRREALARKKRELTPEELQLGASFTQNKGKLPAPVEGVVALSFGRQPHPVLKNVYIENRGIDIQSEGGATVRAIFEGTVVSVLFSPVFQYAVLIRHGEYYTVYSGLKQVFVKAGEEVSALKPIGKLAEGPTAELHFELWKGTDPLNPEEWLRFR